MFINKPNFDQKAIANFRNAGAFNVVEPEHRPRRGRVRYGKTARDHKSGAWKNRFTNRSIREAYLEDASRLSSAGMGAQASTGWKAGTSVPTVY